MKALRRVAPAILLFFLAPLIAEFVLGDLTFKELGAFIVLAPLYGGGGILIREAVRRTGRGWPTFVLLALGYAILEEAILTQSLFNPNYLHLRLLDYGYLPNFGTALPWAIFVLTIHVIWSLAVPIGLVEAAFPDRRETPWLRWPGLLVTAVLFLAGALLSLRFSLSQTSFRASPVQIGISAFLILMVVAGAFLIFPARKSASSARREAVNPVTLAVASLVIGSAIQVINSAGKAHLPWPVTVAFESVAALTALIFFAWANKNRPWTSVQSWAAACGGLLCYVWVGYFVDHALHGPGNALAHTLFVAVALAIAAWAGMRAFGERAGTTNARGIGASPDGVAIS
jgi:hypothetical protein